MEDEICNYVPMLQQRRQRLDACNKVLTPISTNAVRKGANRFGQLDDNGKNGTNDKDNNSNKIKKVVDRRKSHGGTGAGLIQDACPGQTRMASCTGRGIYYAVAHTTRTILAMDQITAVCKEMDVRANKEVVEGSMGHVETLKQCFT